MINYIHVINHVYYKKFKEFVMDSGTILSVVTIIIFLLLGVAWSEFEARFKR